MMQKEKTKVYTYTRVSTAMQVDGYSLDAQKAKMKAYADYNDYEIVGEYEDAGKLMISVLSAEPECMEIKASSTKRTAPSTRIFTTTVASTAL